MIFKILCFIPVLFHSFKKPCLPTDNPPVILRYELFVFLYRFLPSGRWYLCYSIGKTFDSISCWKVIVL